MVRLDGNIDVRGFLVNGADNIGNGGHVTIDAAYLFQNGNIYAGGLNGGNVQVNVGGMTMSSTAHIDATGQLYVPPDDDMSVLGSGGKVIILSSRNISMQKGASIVTNGGSGLQPPTPQSQTLMGNDIVIIGHGVNIDGILSAGNTLPLDNAGRGIIRIAATGQDGNVNIGKDAFVQTTSGLITLTANHNINQYGQILNNGTAYSNPNSDDTSLAPGTQGFSGGITTLSAGHAIYNKGRISADGHNSSGGYPDDIEGSFPGFSGGAGGVITLNSRHIKNSGVLSAAGGSANFSPYSGLPIDPTNDLTVGAGGDGGMVNFSSTPTGLGTVATYQGVGATAQNLATFGFASPKLGTITAPNPEASPNKLIGVWENNP